MTTNLPTYNGYANYPTWAVNLWIDNDQGLQEYFAEQAQAALDDNEGDKDAAKYDLADDIHTYMDDLIEEFTPGIFTGMTGDLFGFAYGFVDWQEIAENMLYDLEWEDPDQEDEEE